MGGKAGDTGGPLQPARVHREQEQGEDEGRDELRRLAQRADDRAAREIGHLRREGRASRAHVAASLAARSA